MATSDEQKPESKRIVQPFCYPLTVEQELQNYLDYCEGENLPFPSLCLLNFARWVELLRAADISPKQEKSIIVYQDIKFIWDPSIQPADMVFYCEHK